jgi:CHAT domain-containing protein
MAGSLDAAITLHLNHLATYPEAANLAFSTLLQRKGRVLDLFTNLRRRLANDPEVVKLFDQLNQVNAQLSALTSRANPTDPAYQSQLTNLNDQISTLENQLSRRSSEFATLTTAPTLTSIQAQLPPDTALVEFVRYRPFDPSAPSSQEFGPPRYAVYLLKPGAQVEGLDLGPAQPIDAAIDALTTSLAAADTPLFQVKEAAQTLYNQVMAPLGPGLAGTTTLFLAPDGPLSLVPFEALVNDNRYLVETYHFRYLTAGRDLLRLQDSPPPSTPAVLVGNPTYDPSGTVVVSANTLAIDLKAKRFPALPATQTEVDQLAKELPGATTYSRTNATEAVVKQLHSPDILHIATHGFFEPVTETVNPLLQSGLILAGATTGQSGLGQDGLPEDGILTALEVTGLDLRGTELVVLSACQTGLGELASGEGVYGLRRALVLAGSQSQVISLWKVADQATQEFMVAYYKKLQAGLSRDESLRDTQRQFLHSDATQHPYYWAAFITSGQWQPLKSQTLGQ